jgi:DNA-binding transcriptional LysR family regulator
MNLHHLRVFLTVAEHEHVTRAAEELQLSQPAVTKIIQNLEHDTGLELVERHGRHIVLTHAGRVLHSYARRVFTLEREMEETLATLRDDHSGEITFAANPTTAAYLLPPIVAAFRERYPQVLLHIGVLNSHEIVEQIVNWILDFGLVESDPSRLPEGLLVQVFAYDELVLVVAPGHRWAKLKALQPEELQHEELLLREQGSGIREVIERAFLQHNVLLRPLLTIPDNEAIKQLVMSGVGAAIVSELTVRRALANGILIRIPILGVDLHPQLSLIQRTDKHLSQAAQAFCTLLRFSNDGDHI